jgi:UPF0755 protein
MLLRFLNFIWNTWLTGLLYLLAILGYIFYAIMWTYRYMSTRRIFRAFLIICILAGAAAILFIPRPAPDRQVPVTIAPGESLHSVCTALKRTGVVSSSTILLGWIKIKGYERRIQAGDYVFIKGEGIFAAAEKLLHAWVKEISVTIPEGLTFEQIAALVHRALGIDTTEFDSLCRDSGFIAQCKLPGPSLEGYLFPETYRFPEKATARDIIGRMTAMFIQRYNGVKIDSAVDARCDQRQIVILASIVEKEATLPEERGRIAAVFHNRLRMGYALGADPTVRYILKKFSGPLRVSELNIDSPYNTRIKIGLPPGPICSPGFACLQAVAMPPRTNELYFVAKWDGSGAHDFSVSLVEHERKKNEIRTNNNKRLQALKEASR